MLVAPAMGPTVVRSSLEVMLDSLRKKDEQPPDLMPALAVRPVSRGRLPSSKRSLPVNFDAESNGVKENKKQEVVSKGSCFGGREVVNADQPEELPYSEMPESESYVERWLDEVRGSGPSTSPSLSMGTGDGKELNYVLEKIASLEEIRQQTVQGIVRVQKHFRGLRARRYFEDVKNGIIVLQSAIRGSLARKHSNALERKMTKTNHVKADGGPDFKLHDLVDTSKEQFQVRDAVVEDLQRQVLKSEAALRIKEEETLKLKQQIHQYEARWSDYEMKMKSLEEMWQKQMTSLQMSLAAAKQSFAADDKASLPGVHDTSPTNHHFDSEVTMSAEFQTPEGTPPKQPHASATVLPRNFDTTRNTIRCMVKEFEQQKRVFADDARFLIELKSSYSLANMNPDEELQKLKVRFATWKKDYKVKLWETKVELQKLGNSEVMKSRRKWWSMRSVK